MLNHRKWKAKEWFWNKPEGKLYLSLWEGKDKDYVWYLRIHAGKKQVKGDV